MLNLKEDNDVALSEKEYKDFVDFLYSNLPSKATFDVNFIKPMIFITDTMAKARAFYLQ